MRASTREIIFVRGTTEAINLVAQSWGRTQLRPGDEILDLRARASRQHRALADGRRRHGRDLRGRADRSSAASCASRHSERCSNERTRLVAMAHVSNALGTVLPVARHRRRRASSGRARADRWRAGGARTCRSTCARWAATSTASPATRCTARPASACCTGGRQLLEAMPPWQGGGDMIRTVVLRAAAPGTTCRTSSRPARRTSAAPSGLAAAHGLPRDARHWSASRRTSIGCSIAATEALSRHPGHHDCTAPHAHKAAVLSFTLDGRASA